MSKIKFKIAIEKPPERNPLALDAKMRKSGKFKDRRDKRKSPRHWRHWNEE